MRKIHFILIIMLLAVMPLFANGSSENNKGSGSTSSGEILSETSGTTGTPSTVDYTTNESKEINTLLKAGNVKGTFVGFSSSAEITPIASLELKLSTTAPTAEIDSLTADGEFYVYWIIRSNTSTLDITLSWDTSKGVGITTYKKTESAETEFSNGAKVMEGIKDSNTAGSQQFHIVTENLLDKLYNHDYTINFTVKVGSAG